LSYTGNLLKGPLASVGDVLAITQKKNLRNNGESGCGCLYSESTPNQRKVLQKTQKYNNLLKTNQKNTKTEI